MGWTGELWSNRILLILDLTEELLKSSAARHWAREGAREDRAREGKVGSLQLLADVQQGASTIYICDSAQHVQFTCPHVPLLQGSGMSHSNSVTSKDSGLPDNSSSNHSSGASSSGSTDTGKVVRRQT